MATAEEMVARLDAARAAGDDPSETIVEFFDDPVHIEHVPALPIDGPMSPVQVLDGIRSEVAALTRAMPDLRREASYTAVDGTIVARTRMRGTLGDGTALDAPMDLTYTLEGGAISTITAVIDLDSAEVLLRALTEAGVFGS